MVKKLKEKEYFSGIAIAALVLLITYLHYSTAHGILALHAIYRELYFIPLLFGALRFGLKGTLITYLFITVLYVPYIFMSWTGVFIAELNRLLDILILGVFAFLAGFFIDRDRRRRKQLQRDHYLANIGQVATTIVHDLKNPLITILGFARRIQEGKGKTDTAVQEIIGSAENMQKIVHDVLDFAKPLRLQLKEDDITNVINRACEFCKAKAEVQGVMISRNLPAEPVKVAIDSFYLERAIANLISNAIEASHEGQNTIVDVIPEKYYLSIRIKDEGPGMDKETLENIFIPFYSKKSGGTGLGMPIAKKIIEEHKGEIHLNSKPGQGTEITLRLPYRQIMKSEGSK